MFVSLSLYYIIRKTIKLEVLNIVLGYEDITTIDLFYFNNIF